MNIIDRCWFLHEDAMKAIEKAGHSVSKYYATEYGWFEDTIEVIGIKVDDTLYVLGSGYAMDEFFKLADRCKKGEDK